VCLIAHDLENKKTGGMRPTSDVTPKQERKKERKKKGRKGEEEERKKERMVQYKVQ